MSRQVPAEDLLVLARQRQLSEEEERRFQIALQSSRELECLYDAGVRFDDEADLLSGDEARINRLVAGALERIDPRDGVNAPRAAKVARASLVARYFAASLSFGLLLCVTLASAWDYVGKRAAQQAQQAQQAALQRSSSVAARRRVGPPAPSLVPAPVPALTPTSDGPPADASASLRHPVPAARVPLGPERKLATTDEALSSSELFARANQARRKGDIEQAISLYERLGQAYPNSVEAEDAKVLRGNLLLSQRSPHAALRQFEDYHSGALSLEALWGRAQALRKLGSPDEQAILSELVRNYPGSPYAEAAEKRLRELAR